MSVRVLVVGGSGMLGSMLVDVLSKSPELTVRATYHRTRLESWPENVSRLMYTPCRHGFAPGLMSWLGPRDWIINAAGLIKHKMIDGSPVSVKAAVEANVMLPLELLDVSNNTGCSVLQIATDCVFSGLADGGYKETERHDALDLYGKTKSIGELTGDRFHNLRCSIVGPEPAPGGKSLLEWFLARGSMSMISGYVNHRWNGVTTLAFAKVAKAIVLGRGPQLVGHLPRLVQHLVPADAISKHVLLLEFARAYQRYGLSVVAADAPETIDRTLATANPALNEQLWAAAGYATVPRIGELVGELAHYAPFFSRPLATRGQE